MTEKEEAFCGGCTGKTGEESAGGMDPRKETKQETGGREEESRKERQDGEERPAKNTGQERENGNCSGRDSAIWCTSCGRRLPAGSLYCEFCGELIERELPERKVPDVPAANALEPDMRRPAPLFCEAERIEEENAALAQGAEESAASEGNGKPTAFLLKAKAARMGGKIRSLLTEKGRAAAAAAVAVCGAILIIIAPQTSVPMPEGFTGYVRDNSLFFVDRNGKTGELTDYYLDNWREREKARLPRDISCTPVRSEDGKRIWYPEKIGDSSFTLMQYDYNNRKRRRLDSGVVSFAAAGKTAVYEKNNGGLYRCGEDGKEKLSAGVSGYFLSRDGEQVLWLEENTDGTMDLCTDAPDGGAGGNGEKIRLERNLSRILDVSETLDTVLYQKEGDVWILREQGEKTRLIGGVLEVFLPDAEDGSLFFTRQEEGEENLYAFGDGEERLLDREFLFLIHGEEGVLAYKASLDGEEELRLASEYGSAALDCSQEAAGKLQVFGGYAWYTDAAEPGEVPSLSRLSLDPENFGAAQTWAEEAELFCGLLGEEPLYFKDVNGNTGDLYCGSERIAYDVRTDSVVEKEGGSEAFCIGGYDAQAQSGSLLSLTETGAELIEENVSGYGAAPEGLYYFTDYEPQRGRGTLNLYRDGVSEEIETDVWGLYVPDGEQGSLLRQTDVREGEIWQRTQSGK